jgi:hypothetical protein
MPEVLALEVRDDAVEEEKGGEEVRPLAIDLFCGLGGWSEGLLAEGYRVLGFDIERHVYGEHRYHAQLVMQDVRTIHGSQFKDAALIVASPPCQEYSYMAMPFSRGKKIEAEYKSGVRDRKKLTELFDTCFRIQREASEAAGRHIPMVVENVRGAQTWVGKSAWNYGSYHLWGDVPALMPWPSRGQVKVGGISFSGFGEPGYKAVAFNGTAEKRVNTAIKCGGDWFNADQPSISRMTSSKSPARKFASAMIAKIPLPLARHIAAYWKPRTE